MDKKIVLITGASSGIGAATAIRLSKSYRIILCGRDDKRLNEVLHQCEGADNLIWQFDLGNVDLLESSLKQLLADNNICVHYLVHCAGYIKHLPVKSISVSEFETSFRINVISAALILKTLCSKRVNGGQLQSVVLISSNISNFGAKAHAIYSASKAALDGFMRSTAVELAPKVRVNSILPGALRTRMTENIYSNEETVKRMEETYPLGAGETDDIATSVKFLLSDESKWITGQQLTVDGGRTINLSV